MLTQVSTVAGPAVQGVDRGLPDPHRRRHIAGEHGGDASSEAQKIAAQWQQSASDLMTGAQVLAQAQLDIVNGSALVQGDTLSDLTKFVQGMGAQW